MFATITVYLQLILIMSFHFRVCALAYLIMGMIYMNVPGNSGTKDCGILLNISERSDNCATTTIAA